MNTSKDFFKFAKEQKGLSTTLLWDIENKINNSPVYQAMMNVKNISNPYDFTPNIIEERPSRVAILDVFSRLMQERTIFLGEGIDDFIANTVVAQMLYLKSVSDNPVNIFVNSPGGSVYAGLAVYDTMQFLQFDTKPTEVHTTVIGIAASMAYVLAVSGTKGKRSCTAHCRYMQHQPLGGARGQASDIEIEAREIKKVKVQLYNIISEHTKQPFEVIERDCDRDFWMSSSEAENYGCVDVVINKSLLKASE